MSCILRGYSLVWGVVFVGVVGGGIEGGRVDCYTYSCLRAGVSCVLNDFNGRVLVWLGWVRGGPYERFHHSV